MFMDPIYDIKKNNYVHFNLLSISVALVCKNFNVSGKFAFVHNNYAFECGVYGHEISGTNLFVDYDSNIDDYILKTLIEKRVLGIVPMTQDVKSKLVKDYNLVEVLVGEYLNDSGEQAFVYNARNRTIFDNNL